MTVVVYMLMDCLEAGQTLRKFARETKDFDGFRTGLSCSHSWTDQEHSNEGIWKRHVSSTRATSEIMRDVVDAADTADIAALIIRVRTFLCTGGVLLAQVVEQILHYHPPLLSSPLSLYSQPYTPAEPTSIVPNFAAQLLNLSIRTITSHHSTSHHITSRHVTSLSRYIYMREFLPHRF